MNQPWKIVALVLAIVAGALARTTYTGSQAPLAFAVAAAGVIVFFYVAATRDEDNPELKEARLRRAIASAIVIEYLLLVGLAAFLRQGDSTLPGLTETLLNSFTTIVGIVVAFYFGSTAYLDSRRQNKAHDKEPNKESDKTPGNEKK